MLWHRSTYSLSRYTVLLGSHLRTGSDNNRVSRSVKMARNHPSYDAYYFGYDISVLTLSEAVSCSDFIQPVCLVSPYDLLTSSLICYSTGWGLTNYNNSQYRIYRSVQLILHTSVSFTTHHYFIFTVIQSSNSRVPQILPSFLNCRYIQQFVLWNRNFHI